MTPSREVIIKETQICAGCKKLLPLGTTVISLKSSMDSTKNKVMCFDCIDKLSQVLTKGEVK